ncbi:E3 ubiquitin-protein ligase TRIM39-like isoform X1 [Malaclemys terrapin pileata]|uniref:E3 ubiquitin-protein ligase TRIM39-like isoform X1 n=1 Tax=Malaclemys terrapin pileata TaxID=2991368 RepID=UPI0023A841AC|nr:E3 ubiquitin-protein ligase TRIM39-like isoform X1 [Malaclemys terrapin pileata]
MAAENPVESLQEEATCPVCLEYFTEPVTLECGHNFCRACISQCWEGFDTAASCPQCRETVQQRNLRPNRQLANVIEIAKRLSLQAAKAAGGDGVCGEHQETLKLFCEEDQTPICVVCDRSRAHRSHTVIPIQEAAQEYKERIQAHLKTLREEREKLLGLKATAEGKSREYLKQTQTERQKIASEFHQLQQFLEEQERLLLAQLEKLDEEIVRIQNENVSQLSEQVSRLSELISELEGKCQKPASEFLQDIKSTLSRCEKGKFQQPEEISPELEEQVSGFSWKTTALLETLGKFKANVTLDQDTAHPKLILSEDRKSVRWGDTRQQLPNNPERFDTERCVLGCEGFTSGRHWWEVEVGDGELWAVGVARESVGRKGGISLSPEGGIWAVERWEGQFQALTSPVTPLPLSRVPSRIRVCLDCDRGQVTFIDAGDEAPIFTFPPGSVPGERIRPWLWVGGGDPSSACVPETRSRGRNQKSASLASHTLVSMVLEDSCLPSPWLLISMTCGSPSPSLQHQGWKQEGA